MGHLHRCRTRTCDSRPHTYRMAADSLPRLRAAHPRLVLLLAMWTALPASLALGQPTRPSRPEALERAIAARSGDVLKTVRLEYVRHDRNVSHRFGAHSYFHTWCAAGDERVATFWGDDEGVCLRNERGEPGLEYGEIGPLATLLRKGEIWQHRDDGIRAKVYSAEKTVEVLPVYERFFDLRRLGLDPFGFDREIEDHAREYGISQVQYESHQENGLAVVSAELPPSGRVIWWIDPARDYAIVRTATEQDGKRLVEAHYELERCDGVWFPRRIDRYRVGAGEHPGMPASESIEFLKVEFNRPEHPQHFTPTDIGIDAGVNVNYEDPKRKWGIWDGAAVVPQDDYFARLKSGEIQRGPNVTHVLRQRGLLAQIDGRPDDNETVSGNEKLPTRSGGLGFSGAAARLRSSTESEWERYTRRFIQRYALDSAQTERATAVLKDCQERAAKLAGDRKEALDQLATRMKRPETRENARDEMSRELRELRDSLQRVFDEQLKPRLEKLPTRAQREAVREPAASQPAAK